MRNWAKSYRITKSALGKQTLFHLVTNLFLYQGGNPDKPRVLILIPQGVTVIQILVAIQFCFRLSLLKKTYVIGL